MIAYAILLVRLTLGTLFLFQAIDKVFIVGVKDFTTTVVSGLGKTKVPNEFVRMSAYLSSYIELIGGIMLITGIFLPLVYILLAINLVMVVVSFSFIQPLWDMKHVFPRLAMLVFLMSMPLESDVYHLGTLLSI